MPARYCLIIENHSEFNYISEKLMDALLSYCLPVYYGAPNIADYLPRGSFYSIDIATTPVSEIVDIVSRPITSANMRAMVQARQLILDKYNLWHTLSRIVDKHFD